MFQGTLLDKPVTDKSTETADDGNGLLFGASAMQVQYEFVGCLVA